jgi:hypothetical protein
MRQELDTDLRNSTITLLDEVPEWHATTTEWEYLGGLIKAVEEVIAQQDWPRLRKVVDELELARPLRATRLGRQPERPPVLPASEPVRERVNRLVYDLRTQPSQERQRNG